MRTTENKAEEIGQTRIKRDVWSLVTLESSVSYSLIQGGYIHFFHKFIISSGGLIFWCIILYFNLIRSSSNDVIDIPTKIVRDIKIINSETTSVKRSV